MKDKMMDDDVENVGIMQGFLDQVGEEEDELEEEEGSEESSAARVLNRRPDSPEILMNNLRGDMRSVDARREELADLVGYDAAAETPDSVLAMLQPVLAQQGGIGALPQSGPMAQGPQAPMPPPSGGAMGGPPPGAPPLPPGGPPPPAGGDMAALLAAGPPPGGGMAPGGPPPGAGPGPMMGPDGQPIPPEGMPPIQMYRGGEVKRFSDGSPDPDEDDDATQKEDSMSGSFYDLAATSPDVIRLAEEQASNLLRRKAMKVPTRQEAMAGILPEYEKLAGLDPKMAQANLLFDIAGAALGYAANRGPSGEVLRGSPFARFAGAFSGVPANIQKRVADIEKSKQQLRILALDAGEKERKLLQDYNTKLSSEQGTLALKLLDAQAKAARAGAGAFGSSLTGRTINMFSTMAPAFAAGKTTPAQDRAYIEGLNAYMKPTTQTDPKTGETVVVMPPISPVVERSLSKRGFSIIADKDNPSLRRISSSDPAMLDYLLELTGEAPTEAAPEAASTSPTVAPVAPVAAATARPTGEPSATGARQPVTVLGGTPLPSDMAGADVAEQPGITLVDVLSSYGLFAGLRRTAGKLPFDPAGEAFGKDVAMETTAKELTAFLREEYTDAGKILAAERADLADAINAIPNALKTNQEEAFRRFASLTSSFKRARDDALRIAADPVALDKKLKSERLQNYNIKTRQDFLLRAQRFQNMIDAIGLESRAPVVITENDLDRFLANCKPGVPCVYTGYVNGDFKLQKIVLPEQ